MVIPGIVQGEEITLLVEGRLLHGTYGGEFDVGSVRVGRWVINREMISAWARGIVLNDGEFL